MLQQYTSDRIISTGRVCIIEGKIAGQHKAAGRFGVEIGQSGSPDPRAPKKFIRLSPLFRTSGIGITLCGPRFDIRLCSTFLLRHHTIHKDIHTEMSSQGSYL